VQREVIRSRLDRNTKMDLLIRAAQAAEIVYEEMAKKLQQLRRLRNRVHIRTVEELEYASYTAGVANACINILEEFRLVAKAWIEARQPRPRIIFASTAPNPLAALPEGYVGLAETPEFGPPDPNDDIPW